MPYDEPRIEAEGSTVLHSFTGYPQRIPSPLRETLALARVHDGGERGEQKTQRVARYWFSADLLTNLLLKLADEAGSVAEFQKSRNANTREWRARAREVLALPHHWGNSMLYLSFLYIPAGTRLIGWHGRVAPQHAQDERIGSDAMLRGGATQYYFPFRQLEGLKPFLRQEGLFSLGRKR